MTRLAVYAALTAALVAAAAAQTRPPAANEAAWRANNIGVAYLEQYNFQLATASFRQALQADPALAIARLNLGIALLYGGDAKAARTEIEASRIALPGRAEPDYLLGLIARSEDRVDDAIAAFARVRTIDPLDAGASTNLGQLYLQQRDYTKAIELLRMATGAEPFNATAAYGLATALTRSGDPGARDAMDRFQTLRATGYAVTYSQAYLEQGRYGEAIASTGAERELVDPRTPDVGFTDATNTMFRAQGGDAALRFGPDTAADRPQRPAISDTGGAITLADLDGDGDLDVIDGGGPSLRVLRNENGRFVDATRAWFGVAGVAPAFGAIAGDYDNDGRTDLLVLRRDGATLYRQSPPGRFEDVTQSAGLGALRGVAPGRAAAWLDADHDGDLDLFVSGRLLRNNGDGKFTDITTDAHVAGQQAIAAVVPADFDNRRDIDLLVAGSGGPPRLFRNMRDGTFSDVAAGVGLNVTGDVSAVAAGDVNKDGYPDFFFARADGPGTLALSDGRAAFTASPLASAANALAAQLLDYDADGLLDLLLVTTGGPRMLRNTGSAWTDVTSRVFPAALQNVEGPEFTIATGDLDGDGDTDMVIRTRAGLRVWRNDRAAAVHAVHVRLAGRVSNRSGIGAKVDMRSGSLRQRLETFSATPAPAPADIVFGLGARTSADVIRVLWPSGILQAETTLASGTGSIAGGITVEELDRKPSSCPFLFTWNGERFEFITDFLGGGEMGYLEAPPDERNTPQPEEYVRIAGSQLKPRDGRYEIRVTNELEESMFLDRTQLVVLTHPADVEVYPNAGLRTTPEPFRLVTTRDARPPLAAVDDHGHDVLDRVARLDRRFVDDFASDRVRGYAREHSLTLTLPPAGRDGRRTLLLTGWTDYAFSGDNLAASQSRMQMQLPALQVEDVHGWRTVIDDIGFPAGRPQTVTVDLTGKVPASATRVRLVTSMKIYWDRILVDVSDGAAPVTMTRLDPIAAMLSWRGFSKEGSADGREPFGYDYDRVSSDSPWKLMPGRYTREGDVRELLRATDDRFVIARAGDQIALSFDAASLPPLPAGWTRTFLLYGDGFSKEMDLHSASPDELAPIPFHGMKRYPFALSERPPLTAAQLSDLERYHTRIVSRALPPIELAGGARK